MWLFGESINVEYERQMIASVTVLGVFKWSKVDERSFERGKAPRSMSVARRESSHKLMLGNAVYLAAPVQTRPSVFLASNAPK